jgi:hypothetical protein
MKKNSLCAHLIDRRDASERASGVDRRAGFGQLTRGATEDEVARLWRAAEFGRASAFDEVLSDALSGRIAPAPQDVAGRTEPRGWLIAALAAAAIGSAFAAMDAMTPPEEAAKRAHALAGEWASARAMVGTLSCGAPDSEGITDCTISGAASTEIRCPTRRVPLPQQCYPLKK